MSHITSLENVEGWLLTGTCVARYVSRNSGKGSCRYNGMIGHNEPGRRVTCSLLVRLVKMCMNIAHLWSLRSSSKTKEAPGSYNHFMLLMGNKL